VGINDEEKCFNTPTSVVDVLKLFFFIYEMPTNKLECLSLIALELVNTSHDNV
jgi:hypothetical protein